MSILIHSLTLLFWVLIGGCVVFGSAGAFVARALRRNMVLGWVLGMVLGPIGIAILGVATIVKNRRLNQETPGL
jgi:hypothetical protein